LNPDESNLFYESPHFLPCGDGAVSVEFGRCIDLGLNRKVQQLFKHLKQSTPAGLIDLIPSYRSLLIQYDPLILTAEDLTSLVLSALEEGTEADFQEGPLVEIPVCYGGGFGPDLSEVASCLNLDPEEVIVIHSRTVYHTYMIGFSPGFPFLGGLDPRLFIPRKKCPREKVPAGSVGLAGQQTGIYSVDSPGGWQLIGRTPLKLFDLRRPDPIFLRAGYRIRFRPIKAEEFEGYSNH
jgi:KipI family sensor histidine kinase inhibitor